MTRPSEPGSIQSLIEEINAHLVPRPGAFRIHSYEKPGSTIVRVSFENSGDDYHVKIKRPQARLGSDTAGTRGALEREYRNLRALSGRAEAAFTTPRPLYFDRDRTILATSTMPGRRFLERHSALARLLPEWTTGLGRDLERVGRALRGLHDMHLDLPTVDLRTYTERFHANLANPLLALPERILRKLHRYGTRLTALMREREGIVTSHNDFTIHNLLLAPGSIALLDLDQLARNRPERDHATLYISLIDMLAHVPARRRRMRHLWGCFCRGFGQRVTVEAMRPFLIDELVAHGLELSVRLLDDQPTLRRWHLRRLLAASRTELGALLPDLAG